MIVLYTVMECQCIVVMRGAWLGWMLVGRTVAGPFRVQFLVHWGDVEAACSGEGYTTSRAWLTHGLEYIKTCLQSLCLSHVFNLHLLIHLYPPLLPPSLSILSGPLFYLPPSRLVYSKQPPFLLTAAAAFRDSLSKTYRWWKYLYLIWLGHTTSQVYYIRIIQTPPL